MPKEGFKSITVSDDVYAQVEEDYRSKIKHLRKMGINSFAGYCTQILLQDDFFSMKRITGRCSRQGCKKTAEFEVREPLEKPRLLCASHTNDAAMEYVDEPDDDDREESEYD